MSGPNTATGSGSSTGRTAGVAGLLAATLAGILLGRTLRSRPPLQVTTAEGVALDDVSGAPGGLRSRARSAPGVRGPAHVAPPAWEPRALTALAAWEPSPPGTPAGRALAYVWAAPMTLPGLVAGAASGRAPRRREGVLLFAGARGLPRAFFRRRGFSAFALGHVVVALAEEPSEPLLAHELVHVRQAERLGIALAPLYLALNALYGYARNQLERAARRAQRRVLGGPEGR